LQNPACIPRFLCIPEHELSSRKLINLISGYFKNADESQSTKLKMLFRYILVYWLVLKSYFISNYSTNVKINK
jgi:hypothetical protein